MAKNYWVTSTGTVYEGISGHGSWHTEFCNSFLECHEEILKHYDEWYEKHHNYIHIFFEDELRWVKYCGWNNVGWLIPKEKKLTKKQIDTIFELTGYVA